MLIYHPAFDSAHSMFRIAQLLEALSPGKYEIERIRILDFYLLFPQTLENVKFPREALKDKNIFKKFINSYELIEDPKRLFFSIEPYQKRALTTLMAHGIIEKKSFMEKLVERSMVPLPGNLRKAILWANDSTREIMELLTKHFANIDLYGKNGLKSRTDLFEYRYDYV